MTYTGRVEVGGPADVAELGGLTLSKLAVGPLDNNVYLLRAPQEAEHKHDARGLGVHGRAH